MKIPYEKAKELAQAGWPQEGKGGEWVRPSSEIDDVVYAPCFSELREACPRQLTWWYGPIEHRPFILTSVAIFNEDGTIGSEYFVAGYGSNVDDLDIAQPGGSPEEALANLWLYLKPLRDESANKKPYYAQIDVGDKTRHLGNYATPEEARDAFAVAAKSS